MKGTSREEGSEVQDIGAVILSQIFGVFGVEVDRLLDFTDAFVGPFLRVEGFCCVGVELFGGEEEGEKGRVVKIAEDEDDDFGSEFPWEHFCACHGECVI